MADESGDETNGRRPSGEDDRIGVRLRGGGPDAPIAALGSREIVAGRDPECDLVLDDSKVSRRHAALERMPDGRVRIRDLGTTNGTFVAGRRIEEPVTLDGGEEVRLGRSHLEIVRGDPAAQRGAAPTEVGGVAAGPQAARRKSVIERSRSAIERLELTRAVRRATILGGAAVVLAVVAVVLLVAGVFSGEDEEKPVTAEAIVEQVAPSTVLVLANVDGERQGSGTGWVLDAEEGLIVTNAHVVNVGDEYQVGVGEDLRDAELVGDAPCEDLAVLRVDETAGLRTLPIADQDSVRLGETVIAVGFPGTASDKDALTATTGVVSRTRTSFDLRAPDVPQYSNVVQTDTAINRGNSGGPLVDLDGRLVGVNSASGRPGAQNQNYAIGGDQVERITDQLRRGDSIGYTGMRFDYPDPLALAAEGLPPGLLVTGVIPGSPAEDAGIQDVQLLLTAINGVPLDGTLPSYCDAIGNVREGEDATFSIATGPTSTQEIEIEVD